MSSRPEKISSPHCDKGGRVASAIELYSAQLFPDDQIETSRNIRNIFPSRVISRGKGGGVNEFGYQLRELDGLRIRTGENVFSIYDYYVRNNLTGLSVVKDGKIVFERFDFQNDLETKWMSMSMAKSVSSTLVGVAIKDGYIQNLDDYLSEYLPSLKDSSYADVTVRHLLQMSSGVKWDETQTRCSSERRAVLDLQLAQQPGAILEYMARLPKLAPSGTCWNYSTGDTHVVGELLRAATGQNLSDYLSARIWSRLGMQADAYWWLESEDGLEVAGSGIAATAHDYLRFGQFVMDDGVIDGVSVLPDGWMAEAGASRKLSDENVDYGFMWWPVKPSSAGPGAMEAGYSARGIFGQYMYINPSERTIVLVWSARAQPRFSEVVADNDFFNAVTEYLR